MKRYFQEILIKKQTKWTRKDWNRYEYIYFQYGIWLKKIKGQRNKFEVYFPTPKDLMATDWIKYPLNTSKDKPEIKKKNDWANTTFEKSKDYKLIGNRLHERT